MGWLIIGLSGATCSGKTSLAEKLLSDIKDSIVVHQDVYFISLDDPRQTIIPQLNHWNFEILSSLDMEKMHLDILKIMNSKPVSNETVNVLIIEGFRFLTYKPIADLCNLKFFITLTKGECWKRRCLRTYEPMDVPGYFEGYIWPEYLNHESELRNDEELCESITFLNGLDSIEDLYQKIIVLVKPLLTECKQL